MRNQGVKVRPLSSSVIINHVQNLKDRLNMGNGYIDIVTWLEVLQANELLEFEIVENNSQELKGKEAETYPDKKLIKIKQSVWDKAAMGDGRSRFTLAHEFGHFILHQGMQGYARFSKDSVDHKAYEDSEWQANEFAGELLMDSRSIKPEMTEKEIIEKFVVSDQAAAIKLVKIRKK